MKKPTIVYADDEQEELDSFHHNHSANFNIETLHDIHSLVSNLKMRKKLPDLVVLDLYRTKETPGTKGSIDQNNEINKELKRIDDELAQLRITVNAAKIPAAINVLEEIRTDQTLKNLPVLIRSRQGLYLLNDEDFKKALDLQAGWMLKGRPANVEDAKIKSFIASRRRRTIERDIQIAIFGAILGLILSFLSGFFINF